MLNPFQVRLVKTIICIVGIDSEGICVYAPCVYVASVCIY